MQAGVSLFPSTRGVERKNTGNIPLKAMRPRKGYNRKSEKRQEVNIHARTLRLLARDPRGCYAMTWYFAGKCGFGQR